VSNVTNMENMFYLQNHLINSWKNGN